MAAEPPGAVANREKDTGGLRRTRHRWPPRRACQ
jgi:hypothetical protein